MDTYAFVQGMLTVVGILTVVGLVWAISALRSQRRSIRNLTNHINDLEFQFQARMDRSEQGFEVNINELYRELDSRFDKFQARLEKKSLLKG